MFDNLHFYRVDVTAPRSLDSHNLHFVASCRLSPYVPIESLDLYCRALRNASAPVKFVRSGFILSCTAVPSRLARGTTTPSGLPARGPRIGRAILDRSDRPRTDCRLNYPDPVSDEGASLGHQGVNLIQFFHRTRKRCQNHHQNQNNLGPLSFLVLIDFVVFHNLMTSIIAGRERRPEGL